MDYLIKIDIYGVWEDLTSVGHSYSRSPFGVLGPVSVSS